jgi:hypothetical protein
MVSGQTVTYDRGDDVDGDTNGYPMEVTRLGPQDSEVALTVTENLLTLDEVDKMLLLREKHLANQSKPALWCMATLLMTREILDAAGPAGQAITIDESDTLTDLRDKDYSSNRMVCFNQAKSNEFAKVLTHSTTVGFYDGHTEQLLLDLSERMEETLGSVLFFRRNFTLEHANGFPLLLV